MHNPPSFYSPMSITIYVSLCATQCIIEFGISQTFRWVSSAASGPGYRLGLTQHLRGSVFTMLRHNLHSSFAYYRGKNAKVARRKGSNGSPCRSLAFILSPSGAYEVSGIHTYHDYCRPSSRCSLCPLPFSQRRYHS